jgi:hypothetical protein
MVRVISVSLVAIAGISGGLGCGSSSGSDVEKGPADAGASRESDAAIPQLDGSSGTGNPAMADGDTSAGEDAADGEDAGAAQAVGDPGGVTAVSANAFLASIGVCTHVAQGIDAPSASATALSFAGIRNIRDDGSPAHVNDWIAMHASAGVRLSLLTNQNVAQTLDMAEQLNAAGALLAVEGPNEPNNFPVTYEGQTSSSSTTFVPVAKLQRDLYAAVKGEPTLAGIPVFHSSEAGGSEPDNVGLQFLTIPADAGATLEAGTAYADYANTHNYVCGHSSQLVDNVAWNASDPTLNGDWDGPYVEYGHTWHEGFNGYPTPALVALPKVTTETGWVTTGTNAITEEQQARLFLNLYLAAFKRGFAYTFIYMLRDDPNQGYWGLFDTSYNPKTSGTYLHNFTTVIADSKTTTTGKLDYAIANEPATVHDLLLQKSDGAFELVVWDERPSGGSDSVGVDLTTARATVNVYDPTEGTSPTQTLHAVSAVALTLGDHPVVLEIPGL